MEVFPRERFRVSVGPSQTNASVSLGVGESDEVEGCRTIKLGDPTSGNYSMKVSPRFPYDPGIQEISFTKIW